MPTNRKTFNVPRCSPFPVLAEESLDYRPGNAYIGKLQDCNHKQASIPHYVKGDNLVSQLLKEKKAVFSCLVASPYTCYRQLQQAEPEGRSRTEQKLEWKSGDVITPIYIWPIVVACCEIGELQLTANHGVDALWEGRLIRLEKGAILAREKFWQTHSALQSLLCLKPDQQLLPGTLRVEFNEEKDFQAIVKVEENLYQAISRRQITQKHRISILTQVLTGVFAKLALEYGKGEEQEYWRKFATLRALHKKMEDKGIEIWDEDEFDPAYAAVQFHPHEFSLDDGEEE